MYRTRRAVAIVLGFLLVAGLSPATALAQPDPLTNLAHLDFLGDRVVPPEQEGHTTYQLEDDPSIGVLWTYAEPGPGGEYRRLGGGVYDPETDTYGQGAYNADDISRAAVVYLRHWTQFGDVHSRDQAYQLLRGLTYLQTVSGENQGNVVLWMQPDGTLNPSADPPELPDPSDSGASYWLARTIWALGEGFRAFRNEDPEFALFLRVRLELAIEAVDRQVLTPNYGEMQTVDGLQWPSWLIVDGADASSEAIYGLAAYQQAGGSPAGLLALQQLGNGVALMQLGSVGRWPYRAIMPWAQSRSVWHAWGDQMSGALATAGTTLENSRWVSVAQREVGSLHAPPSHPRRPGERLAAGAGRPHPDRLWRRCHSAEPGPHRPSERKEWVLRSRRDCRRLVFREQPGGRADVRPRRPAAPTTVSTPTG